jgi:hypothetical protein
MGKYLTPPVSDRQQKKPRLAGLFVVFMPEERYYCGARKLVPGSI